MILQLSQDFSEEHNFFKVTLQVLQNKGHDSHRSSVQDHFSIHQSFTADETMLGLP